MSSPWTTAWFLLVTLTIAETPRGESDEPMHLASGQVGIEYVAHACFRIHAADGTRLMIDPYASRVWLGYDFPSGLEMDAVLVTHPHYDHDGGAAMGKTVPWVPEVPVLSDPGEETVGQVRIKGVVGKHADPYGKEFGQKNTIWVIEVDGLRVVHLGDNGPLTEANVEEIGRVDVLMAPIDGEYHILNSPEIEAIRAQLEPRILVPMHYRHPDLEVSADSPSDLGPIEPWLEEQKNVVRLEEHRAVLSLGTLLPAPQVLVFPHSPRVVAPQED